MSNGEALTRAPRITRDIRTLPVGTARGQVNRRDAVAHRLAQMVRRR